MAPIRPHRALLLALAAALLGALALAGPAMAGFWTPDSAGSEQADEIDSLYKLVLVIAAVVFFGVEGALIWALVKYRARKGAVAEQIHGNTRLEIAWTAIPAAILVFLVVFTFIKLPEIRNPSASGPNGLQFSSAAVYASTDQPDPPGGKALEIVVDGQQYVWRYDYPGEENVFAYEEMVVPEDTTVVLKITADDVVHSWWIPDLGGKMDAVPGYVNKTWFKARRGVYDGQCAELCGRNHANMLARVRVVTVEEYERWYDQQAADIKAAQEGQAEQREALESGQGAGATSGAGGDEALAEGPTTPGN